MNIPSDGLDVRVGELISLLNYESGDGGAANKTSRRLQWFFTGNLAAGVQLGYKINDWIGVKGRVQNGLYQGRSTTISKTFLGEIESSPTTSSGSTSLDSVAGRRRFTHRFGALRCWEAGKRQPS